MDDQNSNEIPGGPKVIRRRMLMLLGSAAGAAALPIASAAGGTTAAAPAALGAAANTGTADATDPASGANRSVLVELNVNGSPRQLSLDARTTLLDALREHLELTGSKKGCDHGQCGACTVLVGGQRVLGCLTLAAAVRGPVVTVEGLAAVDGTLHPMQQAFIDHDAFQCGYCTPGQILSAIACIEEGHARTDADIREYMSGNLCRCAAYPHIVSAIAQVATSSAPTSTRS